MRLRIKLRAAAIGLGFGLLALPAAAQDAPPDHAGRAVYNKTCAMCHDNPGATRAATLASVKLLSPARLREVISEGGVMAPMAAGLSAQEKTDLIAFLTFGQQATPADWTSAIKCSADKLKVDLTAPIISAGFGVDANQTRNLSAAKAGLSKSDLTKLEVAWAIGLPNPGSGSGASVLGDTVFITGGQQVMALDAATGCAKWAYAGSSRNTPAIGEVNGKKVVALVIGRDIHVIDPGNGQLIWKASAQPAELSGGTVRGGVIFAKDKILVPLSASGVGAGANPTFECCTGHGSLMALSAIDGKRLWEYHTMPEPTYTGQVNSLGVKQRGPSGAPIWSVPLYDAKRNRVFVTTGENTSHPGTDTSDAVIAIDVDTGKVAWQYQAMAADVWNLACDPFTEKNGPNCPMFFTEGGDGRDYDFGAGAVIAPGQGGKDIILAGQKSGHVWALDADTGKVLWSQRVGAGSALGGIHWGITTDGSTVFAPINDPILGPDKSWKSYAGMYAFDVKTGKPKWSYAAAPNCGGERGKLVTNCDTRYGFSSAPLVVDGAVVSGTLGGELFVLDGKTGQLLNKIDTVGPVKTINPIEGKGGSIDAHGVSVGAGMVFVSSGYTAFGETPGNVLIAYKPKK